MREASRLALEILRTDRTKRVVLGTDCDLIFGSHRGLILTVQVSVVLYR